MAFTYCIFSIFLVSVTESWLFQKKMLKFVISPSLITLSVSFFSCFTVTTLSWEDKQKMPAWWLGCFGTQQLHSGSGKWCNLRDYCHMMNLLDRKSHLLLLWKLNRQKAPMTNCHWVSYAWLRIVQQVLGICAPGSFQTSAALWLGNSSAGETLMDSPRQTARCSPLKVILLLSFHHQLSRSFRSATR